MMLYNSMIKSHLMYCINTWCNGNKTMVQKLQQTANNFIRMVFKMDKRTSVIGVMQENKIMTIRQMAHLETACLMFKYFKNVLPPAFNHFFDCCKKPDSVGTSRLTRSHSSLFPNYSRINLTKQSLKYKGPLTWNHVPTSIKNCQTRKRFHRDLFNCIVSLQLFQD